MTKNDSGSGVIDGLFHSTATATATTTATVLLMLALAASEATAQPAEVQPPATTQPTDAGGADVAPIRGGGRRGFGGGMGGGFGGFGGGERLYGPLTQEDRERAVGFAREHMPNVHAAFADTTLPRARRFGLMRLMATRWKHLQNLSPEDSRYERMLRNIRIEDEIFKEVQALDNATPEQRSEIRERLRWKMRQIVETFLQERANRIENLKRMVQQEEQKLKEDRARREALIEARLDHFMRDLTSPPPIPQESADPPASNESEEAQQSAEPAPAAPPPPADNLAAPTPANPR
jgi:hypothetical protein